MKIIEVDGGDGCVAPSAETVVDGTYPIARPLFIYVNAAAAEQSSAVEAYVDFYLTDGIEAVTETGYVAIPKKDLDATRGRWLARETGSAF